MPTSPLQLKHYFFPQIFVEAVKEYGAQTENKEVVLEPIVQTGLQKNKNDPAEFGVSLRISLEPSEGRITPYKIKLHVVGSFAVSDTVPKAYREQVAATNGSQILYGAARDLLVTLTARGPWRPLFLPAIVFSDLMKKESPADVAEKASQQTDSIRVRPVKRRAIK